VKRYGDLFERIISLKNLDIAEEKARKGKGNRKEVIEFTKNREENLRKLHEDLKYGRFKTSKYHIFKIHDPKERYIYKLPYYPDHIVHHAIMNVLEEIWTKQYTKNTYSCIKGRGIHACLRDLKIALLDRQNTIYCLKLDITKFYPSINHDILKGIVKRKIKCPRTLNLIFEIIDSADGLPIGNYLSQFLANLYLSALDHELKEILHVKYYFRYADDMVILAGTKEELRKVLEYIRNRLQTLDLKLKNNWQIFPVEPRGIDFIGYVFHHEYILLRKSIKQRIKKKVERLSKSNMSQEELRLELASYWGWCKHANTKNLLNTFNNKLGYEIKFD
jgi:hypothetical protein